MNRFFITGTDTDCGKTYVLCQILNFLKQKGIEAQGVKPVASGCLVDSSGQNYSEDALAIKQHNTYPDLTNSYWRFRLPVSPHIAATKEKQSISIESLTEFCFNSDFSTTKNLFIEGAGGLLVPLNEQDTWVDFLLYTKIPTILVVPIRLGCLNHAQLTWHHLRFHQLACLGWIANIIDPFQLEIEANITTLKNKLQIPFLGRVGYKENWQPENDLLIFDCEPLRS